MPGCGSDLLHNGEDCLRFGARRASLLHVTVIACALDIPQLAEAVQRRGLTLVTMLRPTPDAAAAVLGWSADEGDPLPASPMPVPRDGAAR